MYIDILINYQFFTDSFKIESIEPPPPKKKKIDNFFFTFQPLKKSTNQKKYSTTSNDTSQRSAAHSRKIHIRAARRKKDRCFHYLAGVLHCYNVFLLVSGFTRNEIIPQQVIVIINHA